MPSMTPMSIGFAMVGGAVLVTVGGSVEAPLPPGGGGGVFMAVVVVCGGVCVVVVVVGGVVAVVLGVVVVDLGVVVAGRVDVVSPPPSSGGVLPPCSGRITPGGGIFCVRAASSITFCNASIFSSTSARLGARGKLVR